MYRKFFTAILLFLGSVAICATTHTVARGENLQRIAEKYNITVAQLVEANPGVETLFYIGLKLNIPEPVDGITETAPAPAAETATYSRQPQPSTNSAAQIYSSGNRPQKGADKGTRVDINGEVVYHPFDARAVYLMMDFDTPDYSSNYGLGMQVSSISHWGKIHVGADLNFLINAGVVDDWGCLVTFGPSLRLDLGDHFFINMPVDAAVRLTFPEGSTDTETTWFAIVNPCIHAYFNSRFGIFAGPQVAFDFSGSDPSFGMTAGLCYSF